MCLRLSLNSGEAINNYNLLIKGSCPEVLNIHIKNVLYSPSDYFIIMLCHYIAYVLIWIKSIFIKKFKGKV